tara:strand:+ start:1217 stop:3079 length:1863 start_codon:yes stop_codon:yes gene_type:complete
MISKKTIEEVFNIAIIEDVIGDFVALKKAGANYKGLSPFSDEKTPSFIVSPSKRIWKDFSSGKGGNVVSFLMEHDGCSYPEAIKYLAKKYNIEIIETKDHSYNQQEEDEKESISILLDFAATFFRNELTDQKNRSTLDYLLSRGLDKNIIEKFQIGHIPKGSQEFYDLLIKKGFKKEILINSGLFIEGKNIFSRFNGRIMFPIFTLSNRVVGFGGRILIDDKKSAKYINSPETLVYQKSKILYGMNFAKTEIIKKDNCYLVEGYLDVISLHQKNIFNVVASSGTAITSEQIRLIKRFTNTITILFDSDSAGLQATYRAVDVALNQDMFVNIVNLPNGQDPDSFSKNKKTEEIENYLIDNKKGFISFFSDLEFSESSDSEVKIKLVKRIINSISLVSDLTKQTIYLQEASNILNIDITVLIKDLEKKNKKTIKKSSKPTNKIVKEKNTKPCQEEQFLFKLLLNHGEKFIQINSNQKLQVAKMILQELQLDGIPVSFPVFSKILIEYQNSIKNGNMITKDFFINHQDLEISRITTYLISEKYKMDNWAIKNIKVKKEEDILFSLVKEGLIRFKLKRISDITREILEKIPSINNEQEKNQELNRFSKLMDLSRNLHKQVGREC